MFLINADSQIFWELSKIKSLVIVMIIMLILNIIVTASIFFKIYTDKKKED